MRCPHPFFAAILLASGCADEPSRPPSGSSTGGTTTACVAGEVSVDADCVPAGNQPNGCPAGETGMDDGTCATAGVPELPCAPGELPSAGSCVAAGIPAEACAAPGFVATGDRGCDAVLPEGCAPGLMAIPGESRCREIAPCGAGPWGDAPQDADTVYVDAAAAAGGDGSAGAPLSSLPAAIAAAAPGATVALAAGSYPADLVIEGKPVHLYGRCPAMVEIVGSTGAVAAVAVRPGASGTTISNVAVRGGAQGIAVSGATAAAERVWVHDADAHGAQVTGELGPAALEIHDSLIEAAVGYGVESLGAEITIERSVIRKGRPLADLTRGRGVNLAPDAAGAGSHGVLRDSVIEDNAETGVRVSGSSAVVERCVLRRTQPSAATQDAGLAIFAQRDPTSGGTSDVAISQSVIEDNHHTGIGVLASTATIDATVVRRTRPQPFDGRFGRGVASDGADTGAQLVLSRTVIEDNQQAALIVFGAEAEITGSIIRRTSPSWPPDFSGIGVVIISDEGAPRARVDMAGTIIEESTLAGVVGSDADFSMELGIIRGTRPADVTGDYGGGVEVSSSFVAEPLPTLELYGCLVEDNYDVGVIVHGAVAVVDATVVRGTQRNAATGKNGVGVHAQYKPALGLRGNVSLTRSLIENNHAHGVGVHGSDGTVAATVVRGTGPEATGAFGRGFNIQQFDGTPGDIGVESASVTITGSVIEDNTELGLFVNESTLTFDGNVVRSTRPAADGHHGRGIGIQNGVGPSSLRWSVVEDNHDIGIFVGEADVELVGVVVRGTAGRESDGAYGDGVLMEGRGTMSMQGCRVEGSHRAGVANFGAEVSIADTLLECNAFHLDGERFGAMDYSFEDRGSNACGCGGEELSCQVSSAELEPPEPSPESTGID